jgi:prepilin-type N-terminal cleavage/methylation domain-containing protein
MFRTRAARRAFTLIEKLVVMAIIAILLAMYLSAVHAAMQAVYRLKQQLGQ